MTSKRRQDVRRRAGRRGGGFSLIEVMLGVLILALGLLGLAAVMPAVVAQQRNAANTTLGVSAAESAKVYLAGRRDVNRRGTQADPAGLGHYFYNDLWSEDYEWEHPIELDPDTGEFVIGEGTPNEVVIPLRERLWPSPASGRAAPVFVWDILFRRVPSRTEGLAVALDTLTPEIEFVIFVRRIDPGIRPSGGKTVWDAILGGSPNAVAVGVDEASGTPTLNGTGVYSAPRRLDVDFEVGPSGERNRMLLLSATPAGAGAGMLGGASASSSEVLRSLASKPGQKLVDNLGNIYTVIGPDPEADDVIIFDPPVPESVRETDDNVEEWRTLHQVVLTPQIPAAVVVGRIPVANPKE